MHRSCFDIPGSGLDMLIRLFVFLLGLLELVLNLVSAKKDFSPDAHAGCPQNLEAVFSGPAIIRDEAPQKVTQAENRLFYMFCWKDAVPAHENHIHTLHTHTRKHALNIISSNAVHLPRKKTSSWICVVSTWSQQEKMETLAQVSF